MGKHGEQARQWRRAVINESAATGDSRGCSRGQTGRGVSEWTLKIKKTTAHVDSVVCS